jgi:hypothetical protein
MKKKILVLFLAIASISFAIDFTANGLDRSESWHRFRLLDASIETESSFGYSKTTVECEYRLNEDWRGRGPSSQPFEITMRFRLPDEAAIIGGAVRQGDEWIKAGPEDVFTAEDRYDSTKTSTVSFLMREKVYHTYWGGEERFIEVRLAPVFYPKPFAFRLTYIDRNEVDVNSLRFTFPEREFLQGDDERSRTISWRFRDLEFPGSEPVFLERYGYEDSFRFNQTDLGWWVAKLPFNYIGSRTDIIRWTRPFSQTPELRTLSVGAEKFYHFGTLPPLNPEDRKAKKVLILYDLGSNAAKDRTWLLEQLNQCAQIGLADSDSITTLVIGSDLQIYAMYDGFIPATDTNVQTIFDRLKNAAPPEISGLPQLLRAAKDFFNERQTDGEVWLLSDANKNCDTAESANQIMQLSLNRMLTDVKIKVFDCGDPWSYGASQLYINGRSYYGNEYLYENMSRLTGGGVVYARNVWEPDFLRVLADVFMPAVDMVETDPFPTGGMAFGRYKLNNERTHFPVVIPYLEIGRHDGSSPFDIDFYGQVDDSLFHKTMSENESIDSPFNENLIKIWYSLKIRDMLQQPQSWGTIEEIGQLSKEQGVLSPYCAFVVPAPDGYDGFMRLLGVDDVAAVEEPIQELPIPEEFKLVAFPNPFNATTQLKIQFQPPGDFQEAQMQIVDILGRIVKELRFDVAPAENQITLKWDGLDENGIAVGSGVYFVRFQLGEQLKTLKLTLMK